MFITSSSSTSAFHRSLRFALSLLVSLLSQFPFGAAIKDGLSTADFPNATESDLAYILTNKIFVSILIGGCFLNIAIVSTCMICLYMHYFYFPPKPQPSTEAQKVSGISIASTGKQEFDWPKDGWEDWDADMPVIESDGQLQMEQPDDADADEDVDEEAVAPSRPAGVTKNRVGPSYSKDSSVHTLQTKHNRVASKQPSPLKKAEKGGGEKRNREKNKKKAPAKMKLKKQSISRQGSRRTVASKSKSTGTSPQTSPEKGKGGGGKQKIKKHKSLPKADKKKGRKELKGKQQPKRGGRKKIKKVLEKKPKQKRKEVDNSQLYDQGVQFYKQFLKSAHSVKSVSQYFEKGN